MWTFWIANALAGAIDAEVLRVRLAEVISLRRIRIATERPDIQEDALLRAAKGEIVTGLEVMAGSASRLGWGVAVADVSIQRLAAALADDAQKPSFSALRHAQVLSGTPCATHRRVFQYLPMSIVSDRWWVVDQTVNEPLHAASGGRVRETIWESVAGPLELPEPVAAMSLIGVRVAFTRGSWFLVALGPTQTLVEYHAWSDPGGNVPASVASRFAASGIPDAIEGMVRLAQATPNCPIVP